MIRNLAAAAIILQIYLRCCNGFSSSSSQMWTSLKLSSKSHLSTPLFSTDSDEALIQAVESLQVQVNELVRILKESKENEATGFPKKSLVSTTVSTSKDSAVIAGTVSSAPVDKELVPISAATARIQNYVNRNSEIAPLNGIAADFLKPSVSIVEPPSIKTALSKKIIDGKFQVTINFEGNTHELSCSADQTILEAALDAGLELPHSCMSGTCLTCPGRLLKGDVDQSEGVLDEEQISKGLILTCVSYPKSDVAFDVISEDEL